ncbi:MAG: glutamate mutase L [Steroidobacteraceae bacterium]
MDDTTRPSDRTTARFAIDIGSTIVKVARIGPSGEICSQQFHPRDFTAGIASQVGSLLAATGADIETDDILISSSANGGLRVGILCLSKEYSGSAVRNQVLLAGANPVFVDSFDEEPSAHGMVDLLIIAGGVDCPDAAPLRTHLERFDPARYRFRTLVYCGNRFESAALLDRFADAIVIANPLATSLAGNQPSVFEAVRRAYLDDLIFKEGVSELPERLRRGVRPTPEVANRGFQQAIANQSSVVVFSPCLLLDIGGATTDLHYTTEIVRDDSPERPLTGTSVGRHVFTDLGIFASRDSLIMQLRAHPRLYEFLAVVEGRKSPEIFRAMREDAYDPSGPLLSYGCLFLALERFASGRGPGLPMADLSKVAQVMLTGGAAQALDEEIGRKVVQLVTADAEDAPIVSVDRKYALWIEGLLCLKGLTQKELEVGNDRNAVREPEVGR